jgi:hypothetical protein
MVKLMIHSTQLLERTDFTTNLPVYLLIGFVLGFLSIFVYIKLAFPFWNIQPVYHVYDFWRCLYGRPFRIYPKFHAGVKTRFCRGEVVDIVPFVDATAVQKRAFVNLVQCYSSLDENILCVFHLDNLDAYMNGHIYGSYLSFYKDKSYVVGNDSLHGEIIKEETPRGCVASRSGELVVRGHKEVVYWMDYLVVEGKDSAKIHRELFETHVYKIGLIQWKELTEGAIGVWVFRRVGELLSGVVPLVRFFRREYEIPNNPGFFTQGNENYPEHVILVEISGANIRKLTDGLERGRGRCEVWGMMDEGSLVGLIRAGVIKVYLLEKRGEMLAVYFFRDTRLMVDRSYGANSSDRSYGANSSDRSYGGAILELAGSIYIEGGLGLFRRGFLGSLGEILKKSSVYRRLWVDDISDNGVLDFSEWYYLGSARGAYYTWNLVSLTSSIAFILF